MCSPYIEIDEWYSISREVGMTQVPTGEVHLQITYMLHKDETLVKAEEEAAMRAPETQAKEPNLLNVNVVRARGLKLEGIEA